MKKRCVLHSAKESPLSLQNSEALMTNNNRIKLTRVLALAGYFGTMAFLMLWIIKISPPQVPKSIALAIGLLPLLLPLRGILHGRVYTHSWAGFVALPYFAFGVDAAIHRTETPWLGMVLIILSTIWFFASAYYSKYKKIEAATDTLTK